MKQYVILISPEIGLPTVISKASFEYIDFIRAGYKEIYIGTKRDCLEEADEMLSEMYAYN